MFIGRPYSHEQHFKPFSRELNSINQYTCDAPIVYPVCYFDPFAWRYKGKEIVTWYYLKGNEIDIEINMSYIDTITASSFHNFLTAPDFHRKTKQWNTVHLFKRAEIDIEKYWLQPVAVHLADMQKLINIKNNTKC